MKETTGTVCKFCDKQDEDGVYTDEEGVSEPKMKL